MLVKEYLAKQITFTDDNGTVSDPSVAVRFYLRYQNEKDPTAYIYLIDPEATKESEGVYRFIVPLMKSGKWHWRAEGEWAEWLEAYEDVVNVPKSQVLK